MWSNLPWDLLAVIFSFLPVDSIARASSACRNWRKCAAKATTHSNHHRQPAWFLAFPVKFDIYEPCCYALNPVTNNWHHLSLEFFWTVPHSIRPVASIGTLLLFEVTNFNYTQLQLGLCNPFTSQFRFLPRLHNSGNHTALGVAILDRAASHFRAYVVGDISEAERHGAGATSVEMYDSQVGAWQVVGSVPLSLASRLARCKQNESVFVKGTVYWITYPRAYYVIGFDAGANAWREVAVPTAERLEFATLGKRNGALALVGFAFCGKVCVWEMNDGDIWCLVDEAPGELGLKLMPWNWKLNWYGHCSVSVGDEEAFCLYTDHGSGMLVCNKVNGDEGRWEWVWVDGNDSVKGKKLPSLQIKGALLHPNIASFLN